MIHNNVQRTFIPGDNWLYYKIYTGEKTTDIILTQVIKPIIHKLFEHKFIDKWFFIRYNDPNNHLRVRFYCLDPKYLGDIISCIYEHINFFIKSELIYKLEITTYSREIERYGAKHIHLAERLFFVESEIIINFLDIIDGEEQELRWLFALRLLNDMLTDFRLDNNQKLELINGLKLAFGNEFGMNKMLKKQIDSKYRRYKLIISEFLNSTYEDKPEYEPIWTLLKTKSKDRETIVNEIVETTNEIELNSYLGSYSHMLINRIFRSKNRLHELVLYSFLFQYYKEIWGRVNFHKLG